MKTLKVAEWLDSLSANELLELEARPIVEQLAFYDKVGTGLGFIIFMVPTIADTGEDVDPDDMKVEYHLKSQPVVKMRNDWYTINDDNVVDMVAAVVRMLTSGLKSE
jgi:hypothetical protein